MKKISLKTRLGFKIWALGMIGVISLLALLPSMLSNQPISLPIWAICLIQLVQSTVILAIAAWVGATLSKKVSLNAPYIESLFIEKSCFEKLRPQLMGACLAGFVVGMFLIGMSFLTPQELSVIKAKINPLYKVLTGVLYGGITEEVLLRWGAMTFILWLLWRFIQHNKKSPSLTLVWIAIIVSSLLFSLAHLPAAHVLAGHLTFNVFLYVMVGNTVGGIIFGFLYQRLGFESAIIAHTLAHLFADPVILLIH